MHSDVFVANLAGTALPFPLWATIAQQNLISLSYQKPKISIHDRIISPWEKQLGLEINLQLDEYFSGQRELFNLPLAPAQTSFQKKLRALLLAIPYGQTIAYGELAQKLETSPRAVGRGLGANPIPIIIPCHRVVAYNGIGGYTGGLIIKKRLLDLEQTVK